MHESLFAEFDQCRNLRAIANLIKWKTYPADVLPMWVADMDFPAPQPIRAAIQRELEHGVLGYASASFPLFEQIAGRMQRWYDWKIAPESIVPIASVNVGYQVAASLVCKPGEGVLIQPPVYYRFVDFPATYHLTRQDAPLRRVQQGRTIAYEFDRERFTRARNAGAKTAMFLLCHPHNPTGRIFSEEELEWMANVCAENDTLICSDDIHHELLLGGARYTPLAACVPHLAERTITLIGAGKSFNVSGLSCAFAIIPQPGLRQRFARELDRLGLEVNSLGLAAAQAAYSGACDNWLAALCEYLTVNRDYLVRFIEKDLPGVRTTVPEATYLAWLDCSAYVQTGEIIGSPYEFFQQRAKVALTDGTTYGPGGENFVRLNFACSRAILEEGLQRMRKALSE